MSLHVTTCHYMSHAATSHAATSHNFKTRLRSVYSDTADIDVFSPDQDCQMYSVYPTNDREVCILLFMDLNVNGLLV